MAKSIMGLFNKRKKEEQKELQHRADQFMQEYKVIRARYQYDFQAYLQFKNNGEGGIAPSIRIIDITKTIAAEEEAEKKAEALKQDNQIKKDGQNNLEK